MNDTIIQVLMWGGGGAITLTQILAAILFKRLWTQTDQNSQEIAKCQNSGNEKIESVNSDLQAFKLEVAKVHPTHNNLMEALQILEKNIDRQLDHLGQMITRLENTQAELFREIRKKEDKK